MVETYKDTVTTKFQKNFLKTPLHGNVYGNFKTIFDDLVYCLSVETLIKIPESSGEFG